MLGRILLALALSWAVPSAFAAETGWPNYQEGDFVLKDYAFADGERLPELKLHYRTFGTPKRNARGEIVNGVLLLHETSGPGSNWLMPSLTEELFHAGQPLDPAEYFIIIPDGIGRGGSSKPSDGMRTKFPHYRYHDIVDSEHRLVTEGLHVAHLRLVIGRSMGAMHCWMWAEMYPDLMDGVVALASQPVAMSGRNWIMRRAAAEAIRHDPDWKDGNYETQPTHWIYTAPMTALMTENPVRIQEIAPTREKADAYYRQLVERAAKADANDTLYGIEAAEDYNPEPELDKIRAKVLVINSADDMVNPPDLGTVERGLARVRDAKYVLIPEGDKTHGHFTHRYAAIWKPYLVDFLKTLAPTKAAEAK
ncbi:MAG: alpha/beta fold hydrolase [Alphaproteobacteria bacterium]|nr:alpha/beta fold hydrolase [Alphaproteobacteria bacterium]